MAANGISTLLTKQAKQVAKLSAAQNKRAATTTTYSGTGNIDASTSSPWVTSNASVATSFLTQATIGAVVKVGATTIGTISSITSSSNLKLTTNSASTQTNKGFTFTATNNGYRTRNTGNINILPTKYSGNTIVDNTIDGNVLINGRPWQ